MKKSVPHRRIFARFRRDDSFRNFGSQATASEGKKDKVHGLKVLYCRVSEEIFHYEGTGTRESRFLRFQWGKCTRARARAYTGNIASTRWNNFEVFIQAQEFSCPSDTRASECLSAQERDSCIFRTCTRKFFNFNVRTGLLCAVAPEVPRVLRPALRIPCFANLDVLRELLPLNSTRARARAILSLFRVLASFPFTFHAHEPSRSIKAPHRSPVKRG